METTPKTYRWLDIITVGFVTLLLLSNIVAVKIVAFGSLFLPAAVVIFPLTYIFGDVLTEVYGYARTRKVIWIGFGANIFMALVFALVAKLPAATPWPFQADYLHILGQTPRIVAASIVAYFVGEFINSYILAKLKVKTSGKHLWLRTIGSTIIGEGVDTFMFISLAFIGVLPSALIYTIMLSSYVVKVGIEVVLTPVTYAVVRFLKRREAEDYYDRGTNFNPFHIENSDKKTTIG